MGQLKALKACKHPRTGMPLPRAVTENEWLDGKRTYIDIESAGVLQSVPESSVPVRLCRASATILDRLRMKRRAGQEAEVAPTAKRRRITGKATPTTSGGTEVERSAERVDERVEAVGHEHRQDYPA